MTTHPCEIDRIVPKFELVEYPAELLRIPTLEEIITDVCNALDIPDYRLKSKSRKTEVVSGRTIICYVARKKTNCSLKTIGESIDRDHTTVMHSCQKIHDHFETNDERFLSAWNRYLQNSQLFTKYDF